MTDEPNLDDCRRLWAAVLIENIRCGFGPNQGYRSTSADARRSRLWIRSKDFDLICTWLNLDPDIVRRRVLDGKMDWNTFRMQGIKGRVVAGD